LSRGLLIVPPRQGTLRAVRRARSSTLTCGGEPASTCDKHDDKELSMHSPPLPVIIDADPPIPFTDEEIGSAAHEKHMPSVRAVAVDPDRGLVLLNLVGADASVSAVIMELLRSKSNGVGFMSTLFARQPTNIPTQLSIQPGIRYTTFRSALATPGGSLRVKNWCLLIATANITARRRRAPIIPPQLLPPPPGLATAAAAPAAPTNQPPAVSPPHYIIGAATATNPDPNALLGHLRAIGVVVADAWAEAVRNLALDAQLATSMPAAGVKCWRIDGDLAKWVDLVRHGIQSQRFSIPVPTAVQQQRAA
jgi:hypothetical protein